MRYFFRKKDVHNTQFSYSQLLFSSFFKHNIFITLVITIFMITAIDVLLMLNTTSELFVKSNNINYNVSKRLDKYISTAEAISRNNELISLIHSLDEKTVQEQLYISYEIQQTLDSLIFMSPEISNAIIFTPLVAVQGFPSVAPFSDLQHIPSDLLRLNYSVMIDDYPISQSKNLTNSDEIAILTPLIQNDISDTTYLCLTVSKFYFYTEFLRDSSPDGYLINAGGKIISSSNLSLYGKDYTYDINKQNSIQTVDSHKYIYSVSDINKYGWYVVYTVPLSDVRRWRPVLFMFFVIVTFLVLLFTKKISHKISIQLTAPLERLQDAFEKASPIPLKECNILEIDNLFSKYNKLIESNNHLIDKLNLQHEKQRSTEIEVLTAQINPHFLYNTLTAISWKALDNNCPDICSLVSKLGKLCRYNYKFKSQYCKLYEEILSITLYMDLQRECMKNKFQYNIEIDDNVQNLKIPRFILQPIVENSIIHGFAKNIDTGIEGYINVSAYIDKEKLIIKVTDNGIGIDSEFLKKLNTNTFHSERHGLSNVIERIKIYCGNEYGLQFTSHPFSVTSAVITLPISYFEEDL